MDKFISDSYTYSCLNIHCILIAGNLADFVSVLQNFLWNYNVCILMHFLAHYQCFLIFVFRKNVSRNITEKIIFALWFGVCIFIISIFATSLKNVPSNYCILVSVKTLFFIPKVVLSSSCIIVVIAMYVAIAIAKRNWKVKPK